MKQHEKDADLRITARAYALAKRDLAPAVATYADAVSRGEGTLAALDNVEAIVQRPRRHAHIHRALRRGTAHAHARSLDIRDGEYVNPVLRELDRLTRH